MFKRYMIVDEKSYIWSHRNNFGYWSHKKFYKKDKKLFLRNIVKLWKPFAMLLKETMEKKGLKNIKIINVETIK